MPEEDLPPMNPPNPDPQAPRSDGPLLDAFQREAQLGPAVVAYTAAEGPVVQAVGQLSSGREVAWLGPTVDTTHEFLDAIGHRFGAAASARVRSELGLQPAPGRPLASRLIDPALAIARRTQSVLAGIDFMTRMAYSAQLSGRCFLAACRELDLDPARLDGPTRQRIDAAMAQRFAAAVDLPGNEVPQETAVKWLTDLLREQARG